MEYSAEPLLRDTCDLGDKIALIGPSKTRKTYFTLQLALVVSALLRNYAPQPEIVAEFWNSHFMQSNLPAVAETSRNVRKKQEVVVSDESIIAQADCSMMEFRLRLRDKCGLTDSNIRKVIEEFSSNGKLERYRKPGSRETWIATPARMEQLKLDWKF